jgi:type IV secretory pathway VirB10-like protein
MSSTVARGRASLPRWARMAIGAGMAVGAAAFLLWMFSGWIGYWFFGQALDAPMAAGQVHDFSMGVPLPAAPPAPRDALPAAPQTQAQPEQPKAGPPPPEDTKAPPVHRHMLVWQATNLPGLAPAAAAPARPSAGEADDDDAGGTGTARDSAYAKGMQASRIDNERPTPHRFPPRYTLRKGLTFDCTPPMPIDTQLPGPLWCDVDHDVYSMDGTMILIPAHSTANAMIEHGLGLGNTMAVVVFTDILTAGPDFMPIPLTAASGASELGQNGVPVDVNEHTWEKLRTTLLFAGVEFLSTAGTAALQSGHSSNTQYNFGSVSNVGQSLAQIAFQHDMNIPTTGYRGPGYPLKVYINNYVDLSKYYDVTLTRTRSAR